MEVNYGSGPPATAGVAKRYFIKLTGLQNFRIPYLIP